LEQARSVEQRKGPMIAEFGYLVKRLPSELIVDINDNLRCPIEFLLIG
jgi:hypothetical protein